MFTDCAVRGRVEIALGDGERFLVGQRAEQDRGAAGKAATCHVRRGSMWPRAFLIVATGLSNAGCRAAATWGSTTPRAAKVAAMRASIRRGSSWRQVFRGQGHEV